MKQTMSEIHPRGHHNNTLARLPCGFPFGTQTMNPVLKHITFHITELGETSFVNLHLLLQTLGRVPGQTANTAAKKQRKGHDVCVHPLASAWAQMEECA